MPIKETELYRPVADYLQQLGFVVRGEVKGCDVAALRNNELLVVELKRGLTIDLLIQAANRQRIADAVYIAIPRPPKGMRGKRWQGITDIIKRLDLGLIVVSIKKGNSYAEAVVHPGDVLPKQIPARRKAVVTELMNRSIDLNSGGSTRTKLYTAYRENAVCIAKILKEQGPLSPKELRALGTGQRTYTILYKNHYGWFRRVGKATYDLTDKGRSECNCFPDLTISAT